MLTAELDAILAAGKSGWWTERRGVENTFFLDVLAPTQPTRRLLHMARSSCNGLDLYGNEASSTTCPPRRHTRNLDPRGTGLPPVHTSASHVWRADSSFSWNLPGSATEPSDLARSHARFVVFFQFAHQLVVAWSQLSAMKIFLFTPERSRCLSLDDTHTGGGGMVNGNGA